MNMAKGVAGVTLVQAWLLIGIIAWWYYATGNRFRIAIPKLVFALFFFFIFGINYYVLAARRHGVVFNNEFNNFPTRRKVLLIAAALGLIAFSFAFSSFSASYVHSHRVAI
jgi:hypothetical protein